MSKILVKAQMEFSQSAARLIIKASELGFGVTLGETWRSPETARHNAETGTGIANSLHIDRLAIDINLFRSDGTYITDSTGHTTLGAWWKSLGSNYRWGGDFERMDCNHYSLSIGDGRA